jgi:glycine cleavage system H protein
MPYPPELKYTNDHEWVRLAGDSAEIGITDYAQRQLGEVVYVELPEVGRALTAGTAFGTIESVKAVSELFAPVTGVVLAVNEALKGHPEEVNARPHSTWMVRVRVTDTSAETPLLDSAEYERLIASASAQ